MIADVLSERLYERSQIVLLENQQPGGAYLACPTMPDYQFSWFRDGAYIAYALTLDGAKVGMAHSGSMAAQWESASRFHDWCAEVINSRAEALERSITRAKRGESPVLADTLNARYQADGQIGPDHWPEFQLDGPGMWLWSLKAYVDHARVLPLPLNWEQAVDLAARYLATMWSTPCHDYWEERGKDIHISTLGAIYAGLTAANTLLPDLHLGEVVEEIRRFVLEKGLTPGGELAKSVGLDRVDANLISVAVPHGLISPADPIMQRTVQRIERELRAPGSGVHRYAEDVYYGGGVWVLLALWLAWYYLEVGEAERARELIAWSEAQADPDGNLPEQVNSIMLAPDHYGVWVEKRGEIACPLLWSHAMYLIVRLRNKQ